jgi:hypothetical protein
VKNTLMKGNWKNELSKIKNESLIIASVGFATLSMVIKRRRTA